jgi:AmmeMemoRadiSam system protein A
MTQEFQQAERDILLKTARDSIYHGLTQQGMLSVDLDQIPAQLTQTRGCFVTLHLNKQLRGCIGSLTAHQALIDDVVQNAYSAAFRDPRFAPLTLEEFKNITLDISVLSKPEPMKFNSEADLIRQLRPSIDGLILSDNGHRGTFLPAVWEQLPDPAEFLRHLKNKAGLQADYWSSTVKIERYTAELIV